MADSRLAGEARLLFQAALLLFLVTVVIGILNGLDLVTFSRDQLLTHVHAGTLGWITLAVLGASLWLFSEGAPVAAPEAARARRLALATVGAIALYVVAFASGNGVFRPVAGTLTLLVLVGFWAWALARGRRLQLTVPQLAMLAALTTLVVGAVLGVLLGLQAAGRIDFLPDGIYGAHPSTMVIGYLILAGMAIAEWRLLPDGPAAAGSRLGVAQVALLFLAGLSLMLGTLLDVFPLIAANLPLELAGVGIFLGRLWRRRPAVSWSGGAERLFALSAGFLVVNVGLIAYLIANYADDFEAIPAWLLFALDHSMFIGVMTNALFGLVVVATWERRSLLGWADQLVLWGMNVGLAGFVVGLLLESAAVKRTFSPVMGLAILLGMLTLGLRLRSGRGVAPVAAPGSGGFD